MTVYVGPGRKPHCWFSHEAAQIHFEHENDIRVQAGIRSVVIGYAPPRGENQQCGFGKGPTQTELYKHRSWLETGNFEFRK